MDLKAILALLEPKNQNLPPIRLESSAAKYSRVNALVFQGEEKAAEKRFPALKGRKDFGKKKELTEVIKADQALWAHGLGKKEKMTPREIRRLYGRLYLSGLSGKPKQIVIECPPEWVEMAALGIHVAALNPALFKKESSKEKAPEVVLVNAEFKARAAEAKKALQRGLNTAEARNLMRLLGSMGPNSLRSTVYAEVIKALAKKWGVAAKHCSKKELEKYELLNAVSLGSSRPSQLLMLSLHPAAGPSKTCTVMVGKGLCFDSGGVQGKGDQMRHMKQDMAGSAALLGTVLELVKNKRRIKESVHFLLPLAENMMGNDAMRPDDVWTAGDGQKVEIMHTDAEGRLVMADAICYAKNNLKGIRRVMTVATLTGSCAMALGEVYTGVLCSDKELASHVEKMGEESGDLMHVGPWDLEYDDNHSAVADTANLGQKQRSGGWLQAGFFLNRFVPKGKDGENAAQFCHFDIAGSVDMYQAGRPWRRKGLSSGVGVGFLGRLLAE